MLASLIIYICFDLLRMRKSLGLYDFLKHMNHIEVLTMDITHDHDGFLVFDFQHVWLTNFTFNKRIKNQKAVRYRSHIINKVLALSYLRELTT